MATFREVLEEVMRTQTARPSKRPQTPWAHVNETWRRSEIPVAPPRPRQTDCYRVLGVSPHCSVNEIKRAFRRLALATHPDHAGGNHHAFVALSEAYQQALSRA